MRLTWHEYKYYPYERMLAIREAASLFGDSVIREAPDGIDLLGKTDFSLSTRLTYFAGAADEHHAVQTIQSRLEGAVRRRKARQSTRYSVHGLHEYKGKFNPQVVRAILNILGVAPGQRVLDPFCGSGTTLVECSHFGAIGHGVDINPFAVFLANAKLLALSTPAEKLRSTLNNLCTALKRPNCARTPAEDDTRSRYLKSWFDPKILQSIEIVRNLIEGRAESQVPIFLAITSNLLRDYSLQDPKDLRIRRRRSPLPTVPIADAFISATRQFIDNLEAAQSVLDHQPTASRANLLDTTALTFDSTAAPFDAVITSPPYAMALPYIDTQRLSLVWLKLIHPDQISVLESELVGSRESRGKARKSMDSELRHNQGNLPNAQAEFCNQLKCAVGPNDGFRRQAVPRLLYRYFVSMQQSFRAIGRAVRSGAPFALIVGHNHTTLDGTRYDIETPAHLANIASNEGWNVRELMPLQTYQRYGYHMNNAIGAETLIILEKA